MSKIETTVNATMVVNVETRSVSNGTKTIWEVVTQDGTKWATFKNDLGNKALALKGSLADLKVSIQPWDGGTNYYLNDIRPSGGAAMPTPTQGVSEVAQAVQRAQEAAQAGPEVSYDQYKSLDEGKEKARRDSIERQVAAKVAATLTGPEGTPEDFWSNVESLTKFFGNGITPLMLNKMETNVTSHAALDPGNQDAWVPTDDDIPF